MKLKKLIKKAHKSINKRTPVLWKEERLRRKLPTYSPLEDQNSIIFIHIPKTAGNTIIQALYSQPAAGHDPLKKYAQCDQQKYDSYFKFAFTRDPLDRVVSAFHYLKQGGIGRNDKEFAKRYLSDFNKFQHFTEALEDKKFRNQILRWTHFKPQSHYLLNKQNEIELDFIGRYENLSKDYLRLCQELHIKPVSLRTRNASEHDHYSSYYSPRSIKVMSEMYAEDIERLQYTS